MSKFLISCLLEFSSKFVFDVTKSHVYVLANIFSKNVSILLARRRSKEESLSSYFQLQISCVCCHNLHRKLCLGIAKT